MPRVVPDYKIKAKQRIVDAAISVFAQKGYHKAKMEDIATKLGVSKGAIYQYFKSKEDLFQAVVDVPIQRMRDQPLSDILESGNLLDISTNTFYEKLWSTPLLFSEPTWPTSLMFEIVSEASRNEVLAKSLKQVHNESLRYLEAFFEDQKKKGIIRKDVNTHALAMGLIALQDGLQGYELFGVNQSDTSKTWVEISQILLNGVKANSPAENHQDYIEESK
jgi:AcrR family transcriptional regulator